MKTKVLLSLTCAAMVIAACEEGVYDGFDRRPDVDSSAGVRGGAVADGRGVIIYENYQVIEARNGDTMDTLAGRIGMSGEALASYNGLASDYIPRDKEIFAIPDGIVTGADGEILTTELDGTEGETPFERAADDPNALRHTVEQGETAYSIARLYNVSVTSLASWNNLDRDLTVRIGQQLLIPQGSQQVAARNTQTETAPAAATPTEETTATPAVQTQTKTAARMATPLEGQIIRGYENKPGGNEGLHIQADAGSPVVAADNGEVALISNSVGDTTIVLLRHDDNLYTVYSRVTGVTLKKGDQVRRGQTIASVAPGDPPYLHFEIRKGTQSQDPTSYLN
ncbi:MAG: LysM peptidoglycan-binding domain-containing protein [Pseudomonadota bacterium]